MSQNKKQPTKTNWLMPSIFILILLFLNFYNLGYNTLVNDEYVSYEHSKNILTYGLPINQNACFNENLDKYPQDYLQRLKEYKLTNYGCIWSYNGYLREYLIASSVLLFGNNPFSARFFFALFGVLCVIPFYFISKLFLKSIKKRYIATILFALHPQIILFNRFSGYYSITLFFFLLCIYKYIQYLTTKNKKYTVHYLISSFFLFQSNLPIFIITSVALFITNILYNYLKNNRKIISLFNIKTICQISFPHIIDLFYFIMWLLLVGSNYKTIMKINLLNIPLEIFYISIIFIPIYFFLLFLYKDKDIKNLSLKFFIIIWLILLGLIPFKEIMQVRYVYYIYPIILLYLFSVIESIKFRYKKAIIILLISIILTNFFMVIPFKPIENKFCEITQEKFNSKECNYFKIKWWFSDYIKGTIKPETNYFDDILNISKSINQTTISHSNCLSLPCFLSHEQIFSDKTFIYKPKENNMPQIMIDQLCNYNLSQYYQNNTTIYTDTNKWHFSPSIINYKFNKNLKKEDQVCIYYNLKNNSKEGKN